MSDEGNFEYLKRLVLKQQSTIDGLEVKVSAALKQAEAAENYSRQDCLIFRGQLNVRPNLSLREEISRLIHFHTGVQFPSWCINTAHWLGNGHSIIVRFNNKAVREEIYRNRVPKDPQKRGLFIHESLTQSKMDLVKRCSRLRSESKVSTYYTQGGNVFVKRSRDTPSILVTPAMTDAEIMLKLENQPASYRAAAAQKARSQSEATTSAQQQTQGQTVQGQGNTRNTGTEPPTQTREREVTENNTQSVEDKPNQVETPQGDTKKGGAREKQGGRGQRDNSDPVTTAANSLLKPQPHTEPTPPTRQPDGPNKTRGACNSSEGSSQQPGMSGTVNKSRATEHEPQEPCETDNSSDSDSVQPPQTKTPVGQTTPVEGQQKEATAPSTSHSKQTPRKSNRKRKQNK